MMNVFPNKHREAEIKVFIISKIQEYRKNNNSKDQKLNLSKLIYDKFNANDLSGLDLGGIDFRKCCLDYLNLSSCNLSRCNFTEASMLNTNLNYAILKDTNFTNAVLILTTFINTTLTNNQFKGAIIHFVNFSHAKLNDLDFSKSDITQPNFERCKLNKVKLSQLDLSGSCFLNSEISYCNMSNSILHNGNFFGAELDNVKFDLTDLSKSNFIKCHLKSVSFNHAILTDVNMGYSTLQYKPQKSILTYLEELFTDNGMGNSIYCMYSGASYYADVNRTKETDISPEFYTHLANIHQIEKCLDMQGLNLYQVDGIDHSDASLTKKGYKNFSIRISEIEKLASSPQLTLGDINRHCLFKAVNKPQSEVSQQSKKTIENKPLIKNFSL